MAGVFGFLRRAKVITIGSGQAAEYTDRARADRAVRQSPSDAPARLRLGYALAQAGDTVGAIREYREVLRLTRTGANADPDPVRRQLAGLAHLELGRALRRAGDPDDARAHWREVLRVGGWFNYMLRWHAWWLLLTTGASRRR